MPSAKEQIADHGGASPAVSGPFVAVGGPVLGSSAEVAYGRIGSPLSAVTLPASDIARIRLSGHRLLVTGGTDSWLIDMLTGVPVRAGGCRLELG